MQLHHSQMANIACDEFREPWDKVARKWLRKLLLGITPYKSARVRYSPRPGSPRAWMSKKSVEWAAVNLIPVAKSGRNSLCQNTPELSDTMGMERRSKRAQEVQKILLVFAGKLIEPLDHVVGFRR